jgi:hypothetical protein
VLTNLSGEIIGREGHEVRVDERSWQYDAFTDLQYYVCSHAAPDIYAADEERIVAEVGRWAGSELFGAVAEALAEAARKAPVTVRVVVPDGAEALLFWPLELAYAAGAPLALKDVTLVMETTGDDSADDAVPVEGRLRVLGLFSLPEHLQALRLRAVARDLPQLVGVGADHVREHVRVAGVALGPRHAVPLPVPRRLQRVTPNTVYPAATSAATHRPRSVSIPTATSAPSASSPRCRPITSCSPAIPAAPSGSRLRARTFPASSITSTS